MKNAIILHGGPSKTEYYDPNTPSSSNAFWFPWLQGQLLKNEITASTPEVPHSFDRNWPVWAREVERFDITPETILVGHSTGGGFFVKYLSIHPELHVGKVFLIAPWIDPFHERTKNFFDDFKIDPDLVNRTAGIVIYNSDNDQDSVRETVKILRQTIKGVEYREFHNFGHFIHGRNKFKFPELLADILKKPYTASKKVKK